MNTSISRTAFEIIFGVCMNVKTGESCSCDDEGNVICREVSVKPCMIIRDFNERYPFCDNEFTEVDDAWMFFLFTKGYCRVMDNAGTIYLDDTRFDEVQK